MKERCKKKIKRKIGINKKNGEMEMRLIGERDEIKERGKERSGIDEVKNRDKERIGEIGKNEIEMREKEKVGCEENMRKIRRIGRKSIDRMDDGKESGSEIEKINSIDIGDEVIMKKDNKEIMEVGRKKRRNSNEGEVEEKIEMEGLKLKKIEIRREEIKRNIGKLMKVRREERSKRKGEEIRNKKKIGEVMVNDGKEIKKIMRRE